MSFLDEQSKSKSTTNFVKLVEGIPVNVIILDEHPTIKFQHWIQDVSGKKVPVKCLGYACPICSRNRSLGENYKESPKYNPSLKRYVVNVLNVTLCKRVGDEIYVASRLVDGKLQFPEKDSHGNSLADVKAEPMNQVQILERGPKLFKEIDSKGKNTYDETGNQIPLNQLVLRLVLSGTGRETDIDVNPIINSAYWTDPAQYEDKKFDLAAGLTLTPEEISALLDGVPLSDILAAREAENSTLNKVKLEDIPEEAY